MDIVKGFEMLDVTCTPQVTEGIKTVLGYPEITVNRMYFLIFFFFLIFENSFFFEQKNKTKTNLLYDSIFIINFKEKIE